MRYKIFTLTLILQLAICSSTQSQKLKDSRTRGYYTYIYELNNTEALRIVKKGKLRSDKKYFIYNNDKLQANPAFFEAKADSFYTDSGYAGKLKPGYYLFAAINSSRIDFTFMTGYSIKTELVPHNRDLIVAVYSNENKPVSEAVLNIDGRSIPYDNSIQAYRLKDYRKQGMLKVAYKNETAFFKLENYNYIPLRAVRKVARIVLLPVRVVYGTVFCPVYTFKYVFKCRPRTSSYFGYMAINKPKYRPKDTVKMKAYIVDKKGRPAGKKFYLQVNGYDKNYNYLKICSKELKPSPGGVYTTQFVLGDTLTVNTTYYMSLALNDRRWPKTLDNVSNQFYLEDYQLDETDYTMNTDKVTYSNGEKIVVTASGRDANGFPVKDSRVKLTVAVQWVDDFKNKELFVPTKLWEDEEDMLPSGNTQIVIPDSIFPQKVAMNVKITALFNNSNNESHEIVKNITIGGARQRLDMKLVNDSLVVSYTSDKSASADPATIRSFAGDDTVIIAKSSLPAKIKIDPMSTGYEVKIGDVRRFRQMTNMEALVSATHERTADSIRFDLQNPRKLPVIYIIYKGDKEIESGSACGNLHWAKEDKGNSSYFIKYRYMWAGEINELNYAAHLEDKKINVDIKQPEAVFPGQEAEIKVNVSDYKGQPLPDVNLTGLAVNAQFDRSNIPSLPYLDKSKKGLKGNNSYHLYNPYCTNSYRINKAWRTKAGLDTIPYYRFIYPVNGIWLFYDSILSSNAQFAPFMVNNGYLGSIKMIWLDDSLIYFAHGDYMKRYAFVGSEGWHKLKIRTLKREYTIDSILLKKYYKLDISIATDTLAPNVHAVKMPGKLTKTETAMLKANMIYYSARDAGATWLWQGNRIYYYNRYYYENYVGPFDTSKSIHYYVDGIEGSTVPRNGSCIYYDHDNKKITQAKFDIQIKRQSLRWYGGQSRNMGDTAVTMSEIFQTPLVTHPYKYKLNSLDTGIQKGKGTLLFRFDTDSTISTIRYMKPDGTMSGDYYGYLRIFYSLEPGEYKLYLVTPSGYTFCKSPLKIVADGINCLDITEKELLPISALQGAQLKPSKKTVAKTKVIYGQVSDYNTGEPIAFATVSAYHDRDNTIYATTDEEGRYSIAIPDNDYFYLNVNKYGYSYGYQYIYDLSSSLQRNFFLYKYSYDKAKPRYDFTAADMDYYSYSSYYQSYRYYSPRLNLYWLRIFPRRHRYSYAPSYRNTRFMDDGGSKSGGDYDGFIGGSGDVMGVSSGAFRGNIAGESLMALKSSSLSSVIITDPSRRLLREEETSFTRNTPLKPYNQTEGSDTANFNMLFSQYSSGNMFQKVRSNFSDYAYWRPNLFTDSKGQATFNVKFPDDITQWASYVLAMDGSRHSGAGFVKTRAFNKINASLSMPRFLLPGDTAYVVGKAINLGNDSVNIQTAFMIDNVAQQKKNALLVSSYIDNIAVTTSKEDSITVQYSLLTSDGYSDGEKWVLPLFPVGVNESYGKFYILEKDTSLRLKMNPDSGKFEVFADGNYLDFLLHDIKYLSDFPYWCVEQTASKLSALVMKKNIYAALDRKFHEDGEIHKLIRKLEKGQSDDGSFGWWPNTKANIRMTSYVLHTLYKAWQNGFESKALANGTAFLEKWIGQISILENNTTTIDALNVLSEMKSPIDFTKYINRIEYNKLDLTHKFMIIKIQQDNKLQYNISEVTKIKKETMLGNYYWGADKQSLYDNSIQSSILAYQIFRNDSIYKKDLTKIRNYFFEKKYNGRWHNTVEAASILETILPDILKSVAGKITPSSLTINGSTIKEFPYRSSLAQSAINISKKGTSPLFLTLYQTIWSKDEKPVSKDFTVKTFFELDQEKKTALNSGQPTLLVTEVEVLKTAEYVMIEVPIPAGCSYGDNEGKETKEEVHREYFKNKTCIFCENLIPGKYRFVVELQPRFSGSYTLNPAKAELMYFPTFFGREGIKKVKIK